MAGSGMAPQKDADSAEPAYFAPSSVPEVLELLARHGAGARLLGGGQTLVPTLGRAAEAVHAIVDLRRVAGLQRIEVGPAHLELGAMVTIETARRQLAAIFPVVSPCLSRTANSAVRNRATIGGSVMLRDPASELSTFLVAYGAEIVVAGYPERTLAIADFLDAPGETSLIVRVHLPRPEADERAGFAEILRRRSGGRSLAMALVRRDSREVSVTVSGGSRQPARLVGPSAEEVFDRLRAASPGFAPAALSAWVAAAARRALTASRV